jgi:hypothetical protein
VLCCRERHLNKVTGPTISSNPKRNICEIGRSNRGIVGWSSVTAGSSANRKLVVVGDKIALALVGRVAGMIEEFRTNHRNVGQPHRPLMLTVDSYPTSGRPFYSGGDVIAQFLRSLQRPLDPDNFHLAGRNLSGRFAVTSRSRQAALVAGEHAPKDRHRTFLRLRMRTAKADQSLRTMLSSGQSA